MIKHKIIEKEDTTTKIVLTLFAGMMFAIIGFIFGFMFFQIFIEFFNRDISLVLSTLISRVIPIWAMIKTWNEIDTEKIKTVEHIIE